MTRIDRHEMLMSMANIVAMRSTCSRARVGVVVALDGRSLVSGYNGAPAGMPHCDHSCPCTGGFEALPSALPIDHTAGCPMKPCRVAVHAEANAIAFAARHGVSILGADVYTTMAPCFPCSQLIINAGVKRVWFTKSYRDMSGVDLLTAAHVSVIDYRAMVEE